MTSVAAPDALAGEELWRPSPQRAAASTMASYVRWLTDHEALPSMDPDELWSWSVDPQSGFWSSLAPFFDVVSEGSWEQQRSPGRAELSGAGWFPDVRLNYADLALRGDDPGVVDSPESLIWFTELGALRRSAAAHNGGA
ncbi:MAG: hypothetical protein L0H84_06925 [Pseudonocardia sp.]|nr:hypothetical protein [Pseudonocardia sp.]